MPFRVGVAIEMKRTSLSLIALFLLVLFWGGGPGRSTAADEVATERDGPTVESIAAVRGLVYARPFTLATPYLYPWSKEGLEVLSGYILVLDVNPGFAQPRQTQMPVLYVNSRPVEIANGANREGRVVAIAPGPLDLKTATFFYGSTELPERVDREYGEAELSAAVSLGASVLAVETVTEAIESGGDVLEGENIDAVYRSLADVLEAYSPSESDRIASYRLVP